MLLCYSTITRASVVKGEKATSTTIDDDNVSNTIEQSTEKKANEKIPAKKKQEQVKEHYLVEHSVDNQSSV